MPANVSIEDFCIALYCAHAEPTALVPDEGGRISFVARTVVEGHEDYYRAEFAEVQEYTYRGKAPLPWDTYDRLELSVVELEGEAGRWRVWLNPWYVYEVEFRCSQIVLNGAEVQGSGRHLQDELPSRRPNVPPFSASAV